MKIPALGATLQGYLARPATAWSHPAVLISMDRAALHRELRREGGSALRRAAQGYARRGYTALALDPLSRLGGIDSFPAFTSFTSGTSCAGCTGMGAASAAPVIDDAQHQADLQAAVEYLRGGHPAVLPAAVRSVRR